MSARNVTREPEFTSPRLKIYSLIYKDELLSQTIFADSSPDLFIALYHAKSSILLISMQSIRQSQATALALRPSLACEASGDVNRDNRVDIFDLLELLRNLDGNFPPNVCSDLNRDGRTNIFDLLKLIVALAGKTG